MIMGLTLLSIPTYRMFSMKHAVLDHPIDTLMSVAQLNHRDWLAQASTSKSLAEAVKHYQFRYSCDPPP